MHVEGDYISTRQHRLRLSTNVEPSGLLRACVTSRNTILKKYNVCLLSDDLARIIRLDGKLDTVLLWSENSSNYHSKAVELIGRSQQEKIEPFLLQSRMSTGIENLAWTNLSLWLGNMISPDAWMITQFNSLKKLVFLINDEPSSCKPGYGMLQIVRMEEHFSEEYFRRSGFPPARNALMRDGRQRKVILESITKSLTEYTDKFKKDWKLPEVTLGASKIQEY